MTPAQPAAPPLRPDLVELRARLERARELNRADHHAAHTLAVQALCQARALRDPEWIARALLVSSAVHARMGRLRTAERGTRRAERLLTPHGPVIERARALNLRGFLENLRGRTADAYTLVLQARELFAQDGQRVLEAQALNNLGLLAVDLGDPGLALEHQLQVLELLEQDPPLVPVDAIRPDDERARVLVNLCNTYQRLERYDQWQDTAERAVRSARAAGADSILVSALSQQSFERLHAGDAERALQLATEACQLSVRIGSQVQEGGARNAEGLARRALGQTREAHAVFEQALGLMRQMGDLDGELSMLEGLGLTQRDAGDLASARATLTTALNRSRTSQFGKHQADLLGHLSGVAEQSGDFASALALARDQHALDERIFASEQASRIQARLITFDVQRTRQEAAHARAHNLELGAINTKLAELARTGRLTGLPNGLASGEAAKRSLATRARHGAALSLGLVDIDHFKGVNDGFGHDTGDAVLCAVARLMESTARGGDQLARWGGEEFVLLLPGTPLTGAAQALERLRVAVAEHPWSEVAPGLAVTLSAGVAELGDGESLDAAIARADAALYQAKGEGRNQVRTSGAGRAT